MVEEICLYLELVLFLTGTLLYGFLFRELWRRPEVLLGNWPARLLLAALTLWFGGTLVDFAGDMLRGGPLYLWGLGTALDLLRAWAWLVSLPLLAHTVGHILLWNRPADRWGRVLPLLAYPSLVLFIQPTVDFARAGAVLLAPNTQEVFPWVVLHAVLSLTLSAVLTWRLANHLVDRQLGSFLRLLMMVLGGLVVLLVVGGLFDPWSPQAEGWERLLRTFLLGGLLLPGALFAFYVQRYNLLRLSLSQSTLRHFLTVLVLVLLVMLTGPAVGVEDVQLLRPFVAWGLLLAFFGGTVYTPLVNMALRRSTTLRRLLGRNLSPHELDRLMDRIQHLELEEDQALAQTAQEVGKWLGCEAAFLASSEEQPAIAPFWKFFQQEEQAAVHRLAPPNPQLASLLTRQRLHAVFALRVDGRLDGLLTLASSATGGGYGEDELEVVRLAMRQLAATLALRRVMFARLAEERRLDEQEHLGLLGLISASLAHEIKNPLSSMKALAQSLREDLAIKDPGSEGIEDLDLIVEQIDRLHATSREILGVARPSPGESTELDALIESALYILQAEARKRAVELTFSRRETVGRVPGSPSRWQTVVFNLVLNAIAHTEAGGTVRVGLYSLGEEVLCEVVNPGNSLSEEARATIFEPFVSEGGTGLGLALVARRVEEIGAQVEVECQADEVCFRVKIHRDAALDPSQVIGSDATTSEEEGTP